MFAVGYNNIDIEYASQKGVNCKPILPDILNRCYRRSGLWLFFYQLPGVFPKGKQMIAFQAQFKRVGPQNLLLRCGIKKIKFLGYNRCRKNWKLPVAKRAKAFGMKNSFIMIIQEKPSF